MKGDTRRLRNSSCEVEDIDVMRGFYLHSGKSKGKEHAKLNGHLHHKGVYSK